MTGVNERIEEAVGRVAMRRADLEHALGVSSRMFHYVLSGERKPSFDFLVKLSALSGVSTDYMLGASAALGSGRAAQEHPDYAFVDLWDVEAAAGDGTVVGNEAIVARVAFDRDWFRRHGVDPRAAALFPLRGDSMYPTLQDGWTVLANLASTEVRPRSIYAFRDGEALSVKRLERQGQHLVITSDNPAYETRVITGPDLEQVQVLGEVVCAIHDLPRIEARSDAPGARSRSRKNAPLCPAPN